MNLADYIRTIPDFPEEGIIFRDITTLLKDGSAFHEMVDRIGAPIAGKEIDLIIGPEARGYLFGAPLAYAMGKGFILARKPGKLPAETVRHEYDLEYGVDALEVHLDAIQPGQKVVIVDDLLATGGTALAVAKLVEKMGGEVVAFSFAIELLDLGGREKLRGYEVHTVLTY
jgi:adenine phosphoribosyltransferase